MGILLHPNNGMNWQKGLKMARRKQVLIEGVEDGGELLIGDANGFSIDSPVDLKRRGKVAIHVKLIKGSKIVQGWFDSEEIIKAITAARSEEAARLGLK